MGTKPSIFQVQHSGKPHPELAQPVNAHRSHGIGSENPPRLHPTKTFMNPSVGKNVRAVPVHGGMTSRQHAGMLTGTELGHSNESASLLAHVESSPTAKPPMGKRVHTPVVVVGHRSRTNPAAKLSDMQLLGDAVLREALHGAADHTHPAVMQANVERLKGGC